MLACDEIDSTNARRLGNVAVGIEKTVAANIN
jgi:hypothetical protein